MVTLGEGKAAQKIVTIRLVRGDCYSLFEPLPRLIKPFLLEQPFPFLDKP
jgi:hypothetical protein